MADEKKDGGPAFPCKAPETFHAGNGNYVTRFHPASGMTLRDYFAAKTMAALIITADYYTRHEIEQLATDAYAFADKMLEARSK